MSNQQAEFTARTWEAFYKNIAKTDAVGILRTYPVDVLASRSHFDTTETQRALNKNCEGPKEKTPADWAIECIERLTDTKAAADEIRWLATRHPWLAAGSKKIKNLVEAELEATYDEIGKLTRVSKTTLNEIEHDGHRINNTTARRLLRAIRKLLHAAKAPNGNQSLKAGVTWLKEQKCPECGEDLRIRCNKNGHQFIGCQNWDTEKECKYNRNI
jgi:DNA-binding XRE family transcriptional regulator